MKSKIQSSVRSNAATIRPSLLPYQPTKIIIYGNTRSLEINLARHPLKRNLSSVVVIVVKSWNVDHPRNEEPKNGDASCGGIGFDRELWLSSFLID